MSMRKGVDALQMVFAMFILIVVTLVMIKLFTGIVKPDTLPKIDDFQHAYNYNREVIRCGNLCNAFTTGGCTDMRSAVGFCREKVSIDINGDGRTGERKAYGIIAGIPYCEDGLHCFNIYQCACGYTELDAKECLSVMKDFYTQESGSELTGKEATCKAIQPGECETNPNLWKKKLPGFEPATIREGKYAGQVWGADYWWKLAGYPELNIGNCVETPSGSTTTTTSGSLQFECHQITGTKDVQCSWYGCSGNSDITVSYSGVSTGICYSGTNGNGACTIPNLNAGNYNFYLNCDGTVKSISGPVS
jgi:hypothetical protein